MTNGNESPTSHEEALIRAFIRSDRRPRYVALLGSPRGRKKLRAHLAHMRDLDPRFAHRVVPSDQHARSIERLLLSKGAPSTCHVLSESSHIDGRELALGVALDEIVGSGMGTLVSCIPGRLGYYESEEVGERYVLERAV